MNTATGNTTPTVSPVVQQGLQNMVETVEHQEIMIYQPGQLLMLAVQKDLDIEKLRQLMELQERFEKKQAEKSFIRAMAEFKKNPPKIFKDAHVKFATAKGTTEYDHASIGNVVGTLTEGLAQHGFTINWDQENLQNGNARVTCYLKHIDGHVEKAYIDAPPDTSGGKNNIQSIASTNTYIQRYTLLMVTGFATNENETDGRPPKIEKKQDKKKKMDNPVVNPKKIIGEIITACYNGKAKEKFQKITGLKELKDIPDDLEQARAIYKKVEAFIKKDPDAKRPEQPKPPVQTQQTSGKHVNYV